MRKNEFLEKLKGSLWAMPEADIQNSLDYYSEMIDDRMEDGLSEEEAVAAIGDLDEIVSQILGETPRPPVTVEHPKQEKQNNNWKTWAIILLVVGAPVWVPLIASAAATVFSVYVSLWSVVIVFYVVAVAVAGAAIGCLIGVFFMLGRPVTAAVTLGASLLCAGLAILLFLLANLSAKGMVALTKLCWRGVKGLVKGKEKTA